MYHGYRDYANMRDREWQIIEVETAFQVPLLDTGIDLVGRIDLMARWKRHLWVVDHKAVGNLPKDKELDLDDQTPLYIWAMRQAGYDVRGAMLNHSRTNRLKRPMDEHERFSRDPIFRSDYELETVAREAAETVTMAYNPDVAAPRHPDTQLCKWRCPYLEPCMGGRKASHLERQLLEAKGFTLKPPRLRVVPTT
jgi:hypothetical protein